VADFTARPSAAQIQAWIAHEEAALDAVRTKVRPLVEEEERIGARLIGLRQLLVTFDPSTPPALLATGSGGHTASASGSSVAERVRDQVREILRASDGPMHINSIHSAFRERGWTVPGAGRPANITAHLSDAPDIVSPSRGLYRLLEDGEPRPGKPRSAQTTTRHTAARRRSSKKK